MNRRAFLRKCGLAPLPLIVGGIGGVNLLKQIALHDSESFRKRMKERFEGQVITTEFLIDFVNEVVEDRGL